VQTPGRGHPYQWPIRRAEILEARGNTKKRISASLGGLESVTMKEFLPGNVSWTMLRVLSMQRKAVEH